MPQLQEPKIISGNGNKGLATAVARRMSMHRDVKAALDPKGILNPGKFV